MVKIIRNILFGMIILWLGIIGFMPKKSLYYKLEAVLAEKGIKINEGSIEEGFFDLKVKDALIYYEGIKVAKIDELTLFILLFYTKVELQNLELDDFLKDKAPAITEKARVLYSVEHPLDILIDAKGSFGVIRGKVQLENRTVHIDFLEKKDIKTIESFLKINEKGWYYEKSF